MSLTDLFGMLPKPAEENVFEARLIEEQSQHRIAKTCEGYPAILLFTQGNQQEKRKFNFQNLRIYQDVACQIKQDDVISTSFFTVLVFESFSPDLQNYFLKISESLINSLPNAPTEQQVVEVIFKYIEIFKLLSGRAQKPALGLWAELLVIANSDDPADMVANWHSNPTDKFDFYWRTNRIEVKATIQDQRIHTFSLEQLNPPEDVLVNVASLMTKPSSTGLSILDLVEKVKRYLTQSIHIEKLWLQVSMTLGDTFEEAIQLKFDEVNALRTLKFYDSRQIPKVLSVHVPSEVSNVKFQVVLT